jgi:hypothetical protein
MTERAASRVTLVESLRIGLHPRPDTVRVVGSADRAKVAAAAVDETRFVVGHD